MVQLHSQSGRPGCQSGHPLCSWTPHQGVQDALGRPPGCLCGRLIRVSRVPMRTSRVHCNSIRASRMHLDFPSGRPGCLSGHARCSWMPHQGVQDANQSIPGANGHSIRASRMNLDTPSGRPGYTWTPFQGVQGASQDVWGALGHLIRASSVPIRASRMHLDSPLGRP